MSDDNFAVQGGTQSIGENSSEQPPAVLPEECRACSDARLTDPADGAPAHDPAAYVYALGQISFRFPDLGVEREFAQSIGRADTASLTDQQALSAALTQPGNRYLVRQLCFTFNVQGMETYILQPCDPLDYQLLAEEAVRPNPRPCDLDVVIGHRGALASPDVCGGLALPTVHFVQLYSFDRDSLVQSIEKPGEMSAEQFEASAQELLARILQMTDNTGASPKHRAMNYLAVRCPSIYRKTFEEFINDSSLASIEIRRSDVSDTRTVMEAIFAYTGRTTGVTEKFSVLVDVRDVFPFALTQLSHYCDR